MTKTVYIGAGHGGNGSTAGKRTPDGEYEWNFNNVITSEVEKHLVYNGFKVVRGDDKNGKVDVSLSSRVKLAEANHADIYLSFHHNANTAKWGNWGGTETFYYVGSAESLKLAKLVHKAAMDAYKLTDRGTKSGNHLYEIRVPSMPSVLLEGGFMDSTIDIKKLRDASVLKQAGKNVAKAVCEYFGMDFKEASEVKPVAPSTGKHIVARGETLWSISVKYDVSVADLEKANPSVKASALKIGMELVIPKAPVKAPAKSTPAPKPVTPSYVGKRVESKVDGLNFYKKPSWDKADIVGTVDKGLGFTIVDKVIVEDAYQYKVKNSKGTIYYITASDKYVTVEG